MPSGEFQSKRRCLGNIPSLHGASRVSGFPPARHDAVELPALLGPLPLDLSSPSATEVGDTELSWWLSPRFSSVALPSPLPAVGGCMNEILES